jgi:hypothetical protein
MRLPLVEILNRSAQEKSNFSMGENVGVMGVSIPKSILNLPRTTQQKPAQVIDFIILKVEWRCLLVKVRTFFEENPAA